jgi:hypothetical protein
MWHPRPCRGLVGGRDGQRVGVLLELTNTYPPHIYVGARVHVEYLARALATLTPVEVRTFGTEDSQHGRRGDHAHSILQAASACRVFC